MPSRPSFHSEKRTCFQPRLRVLNYRTPLDKAEQEIPAFMACLRSREQGIEIRKSGGKEPNTLAKSAKSTMFRGSLDTGTGTCCWPTPRSISSLKRILLAHLWIQWKKVSKWQGNKKLIHRCQVPSRHQVLGKQTQMRELLLSRSPWSVRKEMHLAIQ